MNPELLTLVWQQFWQCSLLVLVIWLACRLLRSRRSHLTYLLWLIVLLKFMTPPLWSSSSGLFCWLQREQVPQISVTNSEPTGGLTRVEQIRLLTGDDLDQLPEAKPGALQVRIYDTKPVPQETSASNPAKDVALSEMQVEALGSRPARVSWQTVLLLFWSGVAGAIAVVMLIRFIRCWRIIQSAGEQTCPELNELLLKLSSELGLKRRVRLLVTNSRMGPAVLGLFRPVIVVPAAIVKAHSQSELEPILAHELIHIRRGDLWVGLLQLLASVVWWFHPLVWLTGRRLKWEAEQCCDEEVLAELKCDPRRYAGALLDILELKQTLQTVPVVPGVRPVEITSKRMERIMRLGQGCQKRTPWWCWMIFVMLAAVVLPGAAFVVNAADEAEETTALENQRGAVPAIKPQRVERSSQETDADQEQADSGVSSKLSNEDEAPSLLPPNSVRKTYSLHDLFGKARNVVGIVRAKRFLLEQIKARIKELSDEIVETGGAQQKQLDGDCFILVDNLVVDSTDPVYHRLVKEVLTEFSENGSMRIKVSATFVCLARSAFESWGLETKPIKCYSAEQALTERFGHFCQVETFEPEQIQNGELYHDVNALRDERRSRQRFREAGKQKKLAGSARGSALLKNGQMIRMTKKLDLKHASIDDHLGQERGLFDSEQVLELKVNDPYREGDQGSQRIVLDYKLSTSYLTGKKIPACQDPVTLEKGPPAMPLVQKLWFQNTTSIRLGESLLVGGLPVTTKRKDPYLLGLVLRAERVKIPDRWLRAAQRESSEAGVTVSQAEEPRGLYQLKARFISVPPVLLDQISTRRTSVKATRVRKPATSGETEKPVAGVASAPEVLHLEGMICDALSQKQVKEVEQFVQTSTRCRILAQPEVTFLNGQTVRFTNTSPALSAQKKSSHGFDLRVRYSSNRGSDQAGLLSYWITGSQSESVKPHSSTETDSIIQSNANVPEPESWQIENDSRLREDEELLVEVRRLNPRSRTPKVLLALLKVEKVKPLSEGEVMQGQGLNGDAGVVGTIQLNESTFNTSLKTVSYPVADLVVPIPRQVVPREEKLYLSSYQEAPRFEPLIQLIKQNVTPEEWESGGVSVRAFEDTLSLIVRHTQAGHDQLAELIMKLRVNQDTQIVTHLSMVRVADLTKWQQEWDYSERPHFEKLIQKLQSHDWEQAILLDRYDAYLFQQLLKQTESVSLHSQVKMILFNGQTVELGLDKLMKTKVQREPRILLRSEFKKRAFRYSLAINADDALDVLSGVRQEDVPEGKAVLIDITEECHAKKTSYLSLTRGMDSKSPAERSGADERFFLLLIPRLIQPAP